MGMLCLNLYNIVVDSIHEGPNGARICAQSHSATTVGTSDCLFTLVLSDIDNQEN